MTRILTASALVLVFTGATLAQEPPVTIGNYSAAVEQGLNPGLDIRYETPSYGIDTMTTATIPDVTAHAFAPGVPTGATVLDRTPHGFAPVFQSGIGNVSIPLEYGGR